MISWTAYTFIYYFAVLSKISFKIDVHIFLKLGEWIVIYNDEESHQGNGGLNFTPYLIFIDFFCDWFPSKIKALKCFSSKNWKLSF